MVHTFTSFLSSHDCAQREIENSFASNAGLVHHQVIKTEEGRKRYADLVSCSCHAAVLMSCDVLFFRKPLKSMSSQRSRREHSLTKSHDSHMTVTCIFHFSDSLLPHIALALYGDIHPITLIHLKVNCICEN